MASVSGFIFGIHIRLIAVNKRLTSELFWLTSPSLLCHHEILLLFGFVLISKSSPNASLIFTYRYKQHVPVLKPFIEPTFFINISFLSEDDYKDK